MNTMTAMRTMAKSLICWCIRARDKGNESTKAREIRRSGWPQKIWWLDKPVTQVLSYVQNHQTCPGGGLSPLYRTVPGGFGLQKYGQEIKSSDHKVYFCSFEDLICGLFKRFVHEASAQNATDQYDQSRYDVEKAALAFCNDLRCRAYWIIQPPDSYSFKRKYICGLPHSLVKSIFEACRISAEHSTIEEILEEVQCMETAQKAISLLMKHSNNTGGKPSQTNPHWQNKKGWEGPTSNQGKRPKYFKKDNTLYCRHPRFQGLTKGMTEGMEMNPKGENNRAGSLTREIQPWNSSMAFIVSDVNKKDIWQINALTRWVEVAQWLDHTFSR